MGRLIQENEFMTNSQGGGLLHPSWYFPDTTYVSANGRGYVYTIRSGFPNIVAIHNSKMSLISPPKIRSWIEENLMVSVILCYQDLAYSYVWNPEAPSWDQNAEEVKHGYYLFHFGRESDAVLFKLAFGEYTSDPQVLHPNGKKPRYHSDFEVIKQKLRRATGIEY